MSAEEEEEVLSTDEEADEDNPDEEETEDENADDQDEEETDEPSPLEPDEEEEDPTVVKDLSYYVGKLAKTMEEKPDEEGQPAKFSDSESDPELPDQPDDGISLQPEHMKSLQNTPKKSTAYREFNLTLSRTVCSAPYKRLVDVSNIREFRNLRCVDFGKNYLRDFSALGLLPFLGTAKLYNSGIRTVDTLRSKSFRYLDLAHNKLRNLEGSYFPRMSRLKLNFNRIGSLEALKDHDVKWLRVLELRGNGLKSTAGIQHPLLEELYLAENDIKEIEDLENCPNLRRLHLRDNQILEVAGFSRKNYKLEYVNLRNNLVTFIDEAVGVCVLPNLKTLVMLDNPVQLEEDYRMVMISRMPSLRILDKHEIEPYDRDWAIMTLLDCLYHEQVDLHAAVSDLFQTVLPTGIPDFDYVPPVDKVEIVLTDDQIKESVPEETDLEPESAVSQVAHETTAEETEPATAEPTVDYWSEHGGDETDDDLKRKYWGEGEKPEGEEDEDNLEGD